MWIDLSPALPRGLELNTDCPSFVYSFIFIVGKILIIIGTILIIVGVIMHFFNGFSFFGRLPGDFHFKGENFSFHFPLASGLLVSVILSLILYLINKLR